MAYSRWGAEWPGGSPSWYIYHYDNGEADPDTGKLAIWPNTEEPFLTKADVEHLRDLLIVALEEWEQS